MQKGNDLNLNKKERPVSYIIDIGNNKDTGYVAKKCQFNSIKFARDFLEEKNLARSSKCQRFYGDIKFVLIKETEI